MPKQHLYLEVNNDETFQVTPPGRNVNKSNVSMLLFPRVHHKSPPRGPWVVGSLSRPYLGLLIKFVDLYLTWKLLIFGHLNWFRTIIPEQNQLRSWCWTQSLLGSTLQLPWPILDLLITYFLSLEWISELSFLLTYVMTYLFQSNWFPDSFLNGTS